MPKNNAPVVPASLVTQAALAQQPRMQIIITVTGSGLRWDILAPSAVTMGDAARHVAIAAGHLAQRTPTEVVLGAAERAAMEREQTVLRDSPAARFFPAAKVSICAACADVYAGMLEGDGVIMPPTAAPIPCDYHSERVTPPMPFAEAMRLANAQSAADGEEIA